MNLSGSLASDLITGSGKSQRRRRRAARAPAAAQRDQFYCHDKWLFYGRAFLSVGPVMLIDDFWNIPKFCAGRRPLGDLYLWKHLLLRNGQFTFI